MKRERIAAIRCAEEKHERDVAVIHADHSQCDGCGRILPIICIDTSGEEYATLKICHECTDQLFIRAASKLVNF